MAVLICWSGAEQEIWLLQEDEMSDDNWLMIRLSHFQSNQGKRFDGELHIVHYNTKYRRVSIIVEFRYYRYYCRRLAKVCKAEQNLSYSFQPEYALDKPDGLAVLAVFLQVKYVTSYCCLTSYKNLF